MAALGSPAVVNAEEQLAAWEARGAIITRRSGKVVGLDLRPLGAQVGDDLLATLATFPHLETLDLRDTAVTDAGLSAVAGLKTLKLLLLTGSRVTREGVRAVRPRMIGTRIVGA